MSPTEADLPPEAQALLRQVKDLAGTVEQIRAEAAADLKEVLKHGEDETKNLTKQFRERAAEAEAKLKEADESAKRLREQQTESHQAIKNERRAFDAELGRERSAFEAMIKSRIAGGEWIARAWADYEEARAAATALALETKGHPAPTAAAMIREKGRDLAEARRRAKLAEYAVELYEWHFPWLVELRDVGEDEAYDEGSEEEPEGSKEDPARGWLSKEEWQALSDVDRNQRALDRYLKSRKSNWQLGRDYERYIGYLREQAGSTVTYHGIFEGLEDLGRDVLAEKDGAVEVIQCKRWARRKTIHEKHVFQLYGTVVLARIEDPNKKVSGTFTTTTKLSTKAREVANYLDIKVEESVPLADYPRVKCNIARRGEERIYHLPFDQQYDTTLIEPDRGESYVATVAEAEEAGFRRAWRWRSEGGSPAGSIRGS